MGTGKSTKMTIGRAVDEGLVNNETLGYFMARTQLFLEMVRGECIATKVPDVRTDDLSLLLS